jgi:hypothetical protein
MTSLASEANRHLQDGAPYRHAIERPPYTVASDIHLLHTYIHISVTYIS